MREETRTLNPTFWKEEEEGKRRKVCVNMWIKEEDKMILIAAEKSYVDKRETV